MPVRLRPVVISAVRNAGSAVDTTALIAWMSPERRATRSPVPAASSREDDCARAVANAVSRRSRTARCTVLASITRPAQVTTALTDRAPRRRPTRSQNPRPPSVMLSTINPTSQGTVVAARTPIPRTPSVAIECAGRTITSRTIPRRVSRVDAIGSVPLVAVTGAAPSGHRERRRAPRRRNSAARGLL